MPVSAYDGHEHRPAQGGLVRHRADRDGIVLRVADDDGGDAQVRLDPDEAVRLASSLLRDRGLVIDGVG